MKIIQAIAIGLCMGSVCTPTISTRGREDVLAIAGVVVLSVCGCASFLVSQLNTWALKDKKHVLLCEIEKRKQDKTELAKFSKRGRAAFHALISGLEQEQDQELKIIDNGLLNAKKRVLTNALISGGLAVSIVAIRQLTTS